MDDKIQEKVPQQVDPGSNLQKIKDDKAVQVEVEIEQEKKQPGRVDPPFRFAGLVGGVLSSFLFSTGYFFVRIQPGAKTFQEKVQALFVAGVLMSVYCGVTIIYQKSTFLVPRKELWLNVVRSSIGCIGNMFSYLSLLYIPLGDATAIWLMSPLWTSLLAFLLLGEPLAWLIFLLLPVSLFGILMIAHPTLIIDLLLTTTNSAEINQSILANPGSNITYIDEQQSTDSLASDDVNRLAGVVYAVLFSFGLTIIFIVLRCRKLTPIQTSLFWLGNFTVIFSLVVMCVIGFGEFPSNTTLMVMFLNGSFAWLGQCAIQWALYYERASTISILRTLDVAFSFALSALFSHDETYWTSIVGAVLICLVVIIIITNNQIQESRAKKRCMRTSPETHRAVSQADTVKSVTLAA